jgi:hypothetical protein
MNKKPDAVHEKHDSPSRKYTATHEKHDSAGTKH